MFFFFTWPNSRINLEFYTTLHVSNSQPSSLSTNQPIIVGNMKRCSPFQTQMYPMRRENHPLLLRQSPNRKVSKKGFLERERR